MDIFKKPNNTTRPEKNVHIGDLQLGFPFKVLDCVTYGTRYGKSGYIVTTCKDVGDFFFYIPRHIAENIEDVNDVIGTNVIAYEYTNKEGVNHVSVYFEKEKSDEPN